MNIKVFPDEFATIEGALRLYQRLSMTDADNRPLWLQKIVCNGGLSLDSAGIDELCDRIIL